MIVPKPIITPGIGRIQWEMNLENISPSSLDIQGGLLNTLNRV